MSFRSQTYEYDSVQRAINTTSMSTAYHAFSELVALAGKMVRM